MTCPDCDERDRQDREAYPYIKLLIWAVCILAICIGADLLRGRL